MLRSRLFEIAKEVLDEVHFDPHEFEPAKVDEAYDYMMAVFRDDILTSAEAIAANEMPADSRRKCADVYRRRIRQFRPIIWYYVLNPTLSSTNTMARYLVERAFMEVYDTI